ARTARETFRTAQARQREMAARVADTKAALKYGELAATTAAFETTAQAASDQLAALKSQTSTTAEQVAAAERGSQTAADKATADRAARNQAWNERLDRATVRFMLAPLKSLSPEQLAWASMQ